MKGVVFLGDRKLDLMGFPDPTPGPDEVVLEIKASGSYSEGAAVSCGTGTAFGAIKRMQLSGAETLAVFGQGPVGLSATLLASAMGARVIAVDVKAKRLALAEAFGADTIVDASQDMIRKQLTLLGSWTFSHLGQRACAEFVADRGIELDRIFTHRYKLEEAEKAYTLFDTQTTGKGVFEF